MARQLIPYYSFAFDTRPKTLIRRAFIALSILLASFYFLGPIFYSLKLGKDSCPIPEFPFQTVAIEIEQFINTNGIQILKCSEHYEQFSEFTEDQEGLILSSSTADGVYSDCCVYEISRPQVLKNDSYIMSNCTPFGRSSSKKYDPSSPTIAYFIVKCHHIPSNTSKFNYHARVLTTAIDSINAKVEYWKGKSSNLPVNVLVLVFDSTSAQEAHRQLPLTMKYLLESMDFIQFTKYVVLGEPTITNAIPLLVGQKTKELVLGRKWNEYWDSVNFVWKAFNATGFVTGSTEDIPSVGTFNWGGQAGFLEPPTDVYMRPFFKAREAFKGGYTSRLFLGKFSDLCFGPKHYWNIIYDYHIELLRKLHLKAPVFQIPWLCWPFHDYFGTLKHLDQDTRRFFQQIQAEPQILDNTLIMVLGDHGFRFTPNYSFSAVGLLERRLPLFMIRLPKNLLLQNPELLSIVQSNSQTVTTHYDTYQTLLQLSNFKNPNQGNKTWGQSLFKLLPTNRTCQDAHIPQNWCPCGLPEIKNMTRDFLDKERVPKEYQVKLQVPASKTKLPQI